MTFQVIMTLLCLLILESNEVYDKNFDPPRNPSPLILVPGDGGSRSYASLKYYFISVTRLVWVNFQYMTLPSAMTDIFKLIYDPKTHTTSDAPNTIVTFPGWGSTEMIEDLDEWKHKQTTYFSPLVQELMKDQYYIRDKTLRGAPYDFRKAPNENSLFVDDLKSLIEDTYKRSENTRVVLLGHSLGSLYSLYFLDRMSISWKKQYIRAFVSVSAPLAGAVKALKLEIIGDSLGSPRSPYYFREMQRSFPSTAFLLPNSDVFGDKPLVFTPTKNYSANDLELLFKDMDFVNGAMMYKDTRNLINGSATPEGIDELHCIHGHKLDTEEQLVFNSFDYGDHKSISGDGDSTVNIRSLDLCKKWVNVQYHTIAEAEHMAILADKEFLSKLKQIIYQEPNGQFDTPIQNDVTQEKFIIKLF